MHFRADSFLCVLLRAPGMCAPCRSHELARRARPSLRQWVWTWMGEEGESRMCLLPLLPLPRFFPRLNARCHLFAASHVSIVACQVPWPGFGGPAEKSRAMMNVDILTFSFCAMLTRSFTWVLRRQLAALFVEVV